MPIYHERTYDPVAGTTAHLVAGVNITASTYSTIASWNWGPCNTGTQGGFVTPSDICLNRTPLTTEDWFANPRVVPPGT